MAYVHEPELTDGQLIARVAEGDRPAFEELYRRRGSNPRPYLGWYNADQCGVPTLSDTGFAATRGGWHFPARTVTSPARCAALIRRGPDACGSSADWPSRSWGAWRAEVSVARPAKRDEAKASSTPT
jgi:hypothetical protein